MSPHQDLPAAQARLRMVAQPASVPLVRRFVDEALVGWGHEELVDDVALSVTELVTNSTLHSASTYVDVGLSADADAVRLEVVDSGERTAASIAARAGRPVSAGTVAPPDGMTGRGLFIVSVLASRWGVDDLAEGTRVWAEFAPGPAGTVPGSADAVAAEVTSAVATRSATGDPVASPPASQARARTGGTVVRLVGCPPGLLLAHDEHLADLARDLALYAAGHADEEAARSARAVVEVVRMSAASWDAARLVASQAVREGRAVVDIAIAVADPDDMPRKVAVLELVADTAERMSRQGLLISMPPTAAVRSWREWVARELTEQSDGGRGPRSYQEFLARR